MTEGIRTLVVDDEDKICFFLEEVLRRAGHTVESTTSGEEALRRLRDDRFDLAIVDLNLGGRVDGLRVLEAARWRWPSMAVVILTGHGSLDSALSAIQEGVDGYLLKPAEPEEVRQAAQEALDRRSQLAPKPEQMELLERGDFSVDLKKHLVTYKDESLDLTASEFKLLVHLMENSDRVVPPPELVKAVRGYKPDHLQEARQIIKWYIHRLRQKVEPEPSSPRYITNVRGVGYRFAE